MLLGMIFRLYSEIFVEIQALFPEILRFEFVTLFVKHPVYILVPTPASYRDGGPRAKSGSPIELQWTLGRA